MQTSNLLVGVVALLITSLVASLVGAAEPVLTVATTRFGVTNLMDIDIHGQNARQITKDPVGANSPTWSPDGKHLAYVTYRDGGSQILVVNADGSGEVKVSPGPRLERNPCWSADSKRVLFSSHRGGKKQNIWSVNADGSQPVDVTNLYGDADMEADPACSPDGKRIAVASNRSGKKRLWLINPDGSEPFDVLKKNQIGKMFPCWSSDSRQLVFGQGDDKSKLQLFVVNADGTGQIQITKRENNLQCSFAAWSPDGQYIAYIRSKGWHGKPEPAAADPEVVEPGDLMLYDMVEDKHTVISTGDIDMWGPRPSWRPPVAK